MTKVRVEGVPNRKRVEVVRDRTKAQVNSSRAKAGRDQVRGGSAKAGRKAGRAGFAGLHKLIDRWAFGFGPGFGTSGVGEQIESLEKLGRPCLFW